jgi:sigma-E factor negative regulatory protein RseA
MLALSAAASVAAVAVVGWVALRVPAEPAAGPSVSPLAMNVAKLAPQQLRRNVGEYLIAHQEFSPGTAVQDTSPYQRATYETAVDVAR